ncbi:MAG: hydrogenase 3 maturation endopeptidase HyCI [Candidatus Bathyarchaeia archaeon]
MANAENNLESALAKWLTGSTRIVVAGIGNPIRSDDFVGVKIVQDLQGKVSEKVYLIECETVPESFMQEIVDFKPSHVILVDAAVLGLNTGEATLIFPEQIAEFPAVTTHMLPLRVFCDYIVEMTGAKIALLLIEPENMDFGEHLTPTLNNASKTIVEILLKLLGA